MSSSVTSESRQYDTTSESDLIGLFCPTCNLGFEKEDSFKLHYHSDIHHYNMKRKIVGLKPATEEQFFKQIQKMQLEKEKSDKEKNQTYYCDVLNQKFNNYATYANRLTTKKYQKALEEFKKRPSQQSSVKGGSVKSGSDISNKILEENNIEETNQPTEALTDGFKKKPKPPTTLDSLNICLFTNVMFESFEKNLEQMRKNYGFFILDEKCCKRKEDLIKYLAKLIQKDQSCIYCNQRFKTPESAQKHILGKQHAMMNEEYFGQYEKFYDFREENRRVALELQERFKNVKADNKFVYQIKQKGEEKTTSDKPAVEANDEIREDEDHDEEWEDDASDEDNGGLTEHYNIRKVKRLETGELLLPSGKIAGHRDYLMYYKQKIRIREYDPKSMMRLMAADIADQKKIIRMEQSLVLRAANMSAEGQISLRTYNSFLTNFKRRAEKATKSDTKRLKRDWVKLGVGHNKLQQYFRDRNIVFG